MKRYLVAAFRNGERDVLNITANGEKSRFYVMFKLVKAGYDFITYIEY